MTRSVLATLALLALIACSRRSLDPRRAADSALATEPDDLQTSGEQIAYAERIEAILSARATDDFDVARARRALAADLERVRACAPDDWLFVRAQADGDLAQLAAALRGTRKTARRPM